MIYLGRHDLERAYVGALVAGKDRTHDCKQLRIESNDGEVLSLDEFCDVVAKACLVRASEGHATGWFDIINTESLKTPIESCSFGIVGIICPGNTVLHVNTGIDESILLESSVFGGKRLVMFAGSIESALGIETEARVTRARHTVLLSWISSESRRKIKTMLSMPRGYEAYLSGVPLDDIVV